MNQQQVYFPEKVSYKELKDFFNIDELLYQF